MAAQSYQSLLSDIQKEKFAPVYLFHGEEPFFIDELSKQIAEKALSESEKAFNHLVFYGKDSDSKEIIDASRQYPMMAGRRVVILKEAQMLHGLHDLELYLLRPADTTVLVICHKHKKVDGRSSFYKAALKGAVVFESKRISENHLPAWIEGYCKAKGQKINPEAALALNEYLGNDLSKLAGELDKLILNLPEGSRIEKEHVFDNIGISREYNVFEFQKALGQRDLYKVQQILRHFISNVKSNPLIMLISMLYSYFNKVLIAKSMGQGSDKILAEAMGLRSTYFISEYKDAARNYNLMELENIIAILREFDLKSKGMLADHTISPEPQLMLEMIQRILSAKENQSASGRASINA